MNKPTTLQKIAMNRLLFRFIALAFLVLLTGACQSNGKPTATSAIGEQNGAQNAPESQPGTTASPAPTDASKNGQPLAEPPPEDKAVATFAGGCFWCIEKPFDQLEGVQEAISGYTGGDEKNPTYAQVSSGKTGHTEAVRVIYDPHQVTYEKLLDVFWRSMDPTDAGGQFADRGSQYRPAIYFHTPKQQALAEASKEQIAGSGYFDEPIAVPIEPAQPFYVAETYHQNYHAKNPRRYKRYYEGSGRGPFLRETWKSQAP